MELLTAAELALKVKMSPSRILEKTRLDEIQRIKLERGHKAPGRFDLEAVLKALQGDNVPEIGE